MLACMMCMRRSLLVALTKNSVLHAQLESVAAASQETARNENKHIYHQLIPWRTGKELAVYLYKNALFENDKILALNKPNRLSRYSYMMPLQLSREDVIPHGGVCLNDALPHLMKMTKTDFLNVTLGVHRDASGVIVLSKSKKVDESLKRFFKFQVRKEKMFLQTFWAITHGVPVPEKLETRLALQKRKVGDYVVTVQTEVSNQEAKRHEGQRPYMNYRTLTRSEQWDCALVEIMPTSTRWDSIEVLMSGKLAAILGDHVYSGRVGTVMGKRVALKQNKCSPKIQELPRQLLDQLGLSRKDACHVPQHLHMRCLVLPKSKILTTDLEIIAPIPDYFQYTMQKLDIGEPR